MIILGCYSEIYLSIIFKNFFDACGFKINISSIGAAHAAPDISMYIGAKAAISSFTRGRRRTCKCSGSRSCRDKYMECTRTNPTAIC